MPRQIASIHFDRQIMSRKTFNFHINTTLSEFFRLASVPKYKSSFATSFLQWRRCFHSMISKLSFLFNVEISV